MSTREDRVLARAAVAGCALALAALFWPALQRRVFVYSDLGHFSLPIRMFLARNLEQGITPLWMPDLFCGYYAHGDGQNGIFHPVRWLLYRSLPLSEAFNLECLIPFPLAVAGIALFLRRLALPASAALLGGLTFAFSPYLTLRLAQPQRDRGARAPRLGPARDRRAAERRSARARARCDRRAPWPRDRCS